MKPALLTPRLMRPAVLAAAVLSLSACATLDSGTPEEVVAKRSQDYWNARIKGDSKKAYGYANAAYKLVVTEEQFRINYPGTMAQAAEVQSVKCEAQKCDVGLNLKVLPVIPGKKLGTMDLYSRETWLLEDGQWYLYLEP